MTDTENKENKKGKRNWFQAKSDAIKAWYRRDDNFLRIVRFPGTELPLSDVLVEFFKLFTKGRTIDRAAGVAFNFFLALFPLLLFAFTLIPKIHIPNLYEKVIGTIEEFLIPNETFSFVTETIDGIMKQPHEGLLSLSIILCLVFGSSGIVAIFNGFRNVYANYVEQKQLTLKGWLLQRFRAILMLVVIGVLMILSIVLMSLGDLALSKLAQNGIIELAKSTVFMIDILRWVVAAFVLCFTVSLLYYFGNVQFGECYVKKLRHPRVNGKKYRSFVIFSPGAILTMSLFVLGTVGFNAYISNFSRYNVLYGSIGTLIIIMLWIWIVSILLLAGNDLNNSIRRGAHRRSVRETDSDNIEIIIDDLRRHIQEYEQSNQIKMKRIESLKDDIEEKSVVLASLEKQVNNQALVIEAYKRLSDLELKRQAECE